MAEAPAHATPATAGRIAIGAATGLAAGLVASFVMNQFQALTQPKQEGEPATEQAADAVAEAATGEPLPDAAKPVGGELIHYGLGAVLGVGYGIAAEFEPRVATAAGTLFGAGTWLVLDEAAVPAVGLGDPPWKAPVGTQAYALASHLVFGVAAELTRSLARSAFVRARDPGRSDRAN